MRLKRVNARFSGARLLNMLPADRAVSYLQTVHLSKAYHVWCDAVWAISWSQGWDVVRPRLVPIGQQAGERPLFVADKRSGVRALCGELL